MLSSVDEYVTLVSLCMSNNTFQFMDEFYNTNEGTAMGKLLWWFIANILMGKYECFAKDTQQYLPRLWVRYIDHFFWLLQ